MPFVSRILLLLSALPVLLGASIYRWVDDNGVVNYTQMKPEGVAAELVDADSGRRIGSEPAPTPVEPPSTGAKAEAGDERLSENQQKMLAELQAAEAARQEKIAQAREANCQHARKLLDRLTARGRVRVRGDDGVERVMPEEERQRRIQEAQRGVAANCAETASR